MKRLLAILLLLCGTVGATTRYAGPTGSGSTCSAGAPCALSYLWTVTVAGDTILLNDGHYTGVNNMLTPTASLSGTSSLPITVSAVNDGEVWFDGQTVRRPCYLSSNNDYWVMSGFNCSDSSLDVFSMANGSDHNTVRRVVAWNAGSVSNAGNNHVWAVNYSSFENLIEDCAGFGTGRKILTHFSGSGSTTVRRFFGQYAWNTRNDGPAMVVSGAYNSYNFTMENSILTWDEVTVGGVTNRCGATGCYAIGTLDRLDATGEANRKANMKLYGNILYEKNGEVMTSTASNMQAEWIFKVGAVTIKDTAIYWGTNFSTHRGMVLSNCQLGHSDPTPCVTPSLAVTSTSTMGGAGNTISANWVQTNVKSASTVAGVYGAQSLWDNDGTVGAEICNQYQNGVLTTTPIFDSGGLWPMNQRIIDAMTDGGYTPRNVTTDLTGIFGAIPSACKAGGAPSASITLTSPDAGGRFVSGSIASITWLSQGITGNVVVSVSRDNGSNYTALATVAYDSSPYLWTVIPPKSTQVLWKVCQGATCGVSSTAATISGRLTGIKP